MKNIPISLKRLNEIALTYGTPYQLYDEKGIVDNLNMMLDNFKNLFPNFCQHFAVKALPNPEILKLLIKNGCGLDCSSISELFIAKKLKLDPKKICFTSNYTSESELLYALKMGVKINLDEITLIDTIGDLCNKNTIEFPRFISFRINPGIGYTNSHSKSNILGGPNAKFGIADYQVIDAYKKAKFYGVKKFGIHMMTGSCVLHNNYWIKSIDILFEIIKNIKEELNIDISIVNIGGGIGIPYNPTEKKVDIVQLSKSIRRLFNKKIKQLNLVEPVLNMENGRFITGPYGYLVSKLNVIKNSYSLYYGLDACMANLMRPGMYGSYHHISIPRLKDIKNTIKANVVGTLCENNDWFAKNRELPVGVKKGDLFVIHDTGAHSHSMGFQYNGKLRAPELLLKKNGNIVLIREREKIEDLYKNCVYRIKFDY